MTELRVLVLALVCGGCGLALPDGQVVCAATEPTCPHGMSCAFDGRCWTAGKSPPRDLAAGAACLFADSCTSGHCADGVCCDTPCTDACTTCASTSQPGTCVAVADDTLAGAPHDGCSVGALCRGGVCVRKDIAEPCASASECQSGACVDHVCCDHACGRCEICDAPGEVGSCTAAAAGTDPHLDCFSAQADTLCQASCDGARNCLIPTGTCKSDCVDLPGTRSPTAQPSEGRARSFACSAAGRCEFVASSSNCVGFVCTPSGDACETACVTGFDCAKGLRCTAAGACGQGLNIGVACTTDLECASSYCDPASGKCRECLVNADCGFDRYCDLVGSCQTTVSCANLSCATDGFGATCVVVASATCKAGVSSECTNPGSPRFVSNLCVCNSASDACFIGDVCSSIADVNAHCLGVAGRPCYGNEACASGKCTAHVCEKAGPGVLCRGPADCTGGVCAATAASAGRPVCN